MKQGLLSIFFLMIVTFQVAAQEEEAVPPSAIIKFNPFELITSTFFLEYENLNNDYTKSFSIGFGVTYAENQDFNRESVFGVSGELIQRVYISPFSQRTSKKGNDYMLGIYGGLFVRGGYEELTSDFYFYDFNTDLSVDGENTRSGYWIFPGAMIGVTRTYWEKLIVDLYLGAGIRAINVENSNPFAENQYYYSDHLSPLDYGGVAPNIGFKVGLAL